MRSQRNRACRSLWPFASVTLPLLMLVACDSHDAGTVEIRAASPSLLSFAPPLALQSSREIDLARLELAVNVNGRLVSVPQASDDRWEGSTLVPSNRLTTVQVVWSYQDLVVAQAIRELPVPAVEIGGADPTIAFDSNEFDITGDFDDDGRSNLREFDENTDPRDAADPGAPLNELAVNLSFRLPDELESADESIIDEVQITANIDNRILTLNRNDNVWRGQATLEEGSDVFVRAQVFATTDRTNELARLQRGARVDSNAELAYDGGDYRTTFDTDLDGRTNLDELLAGTDSADPEPTEPAPVAPDPDTPTPTEPSPVTPEPTVPEGPNAPSQAGCEISLFDSACALDTDGDGIPDSEESESADTDNDAIPDYLESAIDDADGDGFPAELDVNESDPCSPDVNADTCVNQFLDTDGDGILDVEEGGADSDGDGKPDNEESFIDDADDDGIVDQLDADENDR